MVCLVICCCRLVLFLLPLLLLLSGVCCMLYVARCCCRTRLLFGEVAVDGDGDGVVAVIVCVGCVVCGVGCVSMSRVSGFDVVRCGWWGVLMSLWVVPLVCDLRCVLCVVWCCWLCVVC